MHWYQHDEPRVGSRVQRHRTLIDEDGQAVYEPYGQAGTVVEQGDGGQIEPDIYLYYTVRWDDGRLDRINYRREAENDTDICDVTPKLFVNVYLWDKSYGGPEEGGWYYDTYEPDHERCIQYDTPEKAACALEAAMAWAQSENADRYPPESVCSEGHYVVRIEAWPAKLIPAQRPHYC